MYLVRVIYVSRVTDPAAIAEQTGDRSVLSSILRQAHRNNPAHGLTGILVFNHQYFMQAIEGRCSAINQLLGKLFHDPRHHDMQILRFEDIARREFAEWSMRFVPAISATTATLLRHGTNEELNPYDMRGESALSFMREMALTPQASIT